MELGIWHERKYVTQLQYITVINLLFSRDYVLLYGYGWLKL